MPLQQLEKLIKEQNGRVILAKMNIDESPEVAQQLKIQSKEVYKISIDVQTQKNGSKFYRGRIKIPQSDRENFQLKTPRKEFLIKRNEMKTLVGRMNHFKQNIPLSIINRPVKILNGLPITKSNIGSEMQYLIYEKYIEFLKGKLSK